MEKRKPLYIPIKTLDSEDYVTGFGKLELAIMSLTLLISIIVGVVMTILINSLVGIAIGLLIITIVFMVVRRDSNNENIITKIKIILEFKHSQRKYLYSYGSTFDYSGEDLK